MMSSRQHGPSEKEMKRRWDGNGVVDIQPWGGSFLALIQRWLWRTVPSLAELTLYGATRIATTHSRLSTMRHPVCHAGSDETDIVRHRVAQLGGYGVIAASLKRIRRARFQSVSTAAYLSGEQWWERHVDFDGDVPLNIKPPLVVVVPHLAVFTLIEADLIRRGHRVLVTTFGPHPDHHDIRRFGRLASFPPGALLRLVRQPHPLTGSYIHNWLNSDGVVLWMPDALGLLSTDRGEVSIRLLGRDRQLRPVVYDAVRSANASVLLASVRPTRLGSTILGDRYSVRYELLDVADDDAQQWHDALYLKVEHLILDDLRWWLMWSHLPPPSTQS